MIYKCMTAGTGCESKPVLGFLCSSWSRENFWCVSEDRRVSCGLSKPSHPQCVVFDVQMRQALILPEGEVIRAEPTWSRENCEVMCWTDLSNEKLSQSVLRIMDIELDTTGKESVLERLSTPGISTRDFLPQNYSLLSGLVTYWKTSSHAQCLETINEFTNSGIWFSMSFPPWLWNSEYR